MRLIGVILENGAANPRQIVRLVRQLKKNDP